RLTATARYGADVQAQDRLRALGEHEQLRLKARKEALNPMMRESIRQAEALIAQDQERRRKSDPARANPLYAAWRFREEADALVDDRRLREAQGRTAAVASLVLLAWPSLWVL